MANARPGTKANLDVDCRYDVGDYELVLVITNRGSVVCRVIVGDSYSDDSDTRILRPRQSFQKRFSLRSTFGWYDVAITVDTQKDFLRRLAGHMENGRDSASDPALGDIGHRGHRWGDLRSGQDVDTWIGQIAIVESGGKA